MMDARKALIGATAGIMLFGTVMTVPASPKQDANPFASILISGAAGETSSHSTLEGTPYTITVLARDTEFIPSVLKAKAGSKIEIRLRNEGKEPHNLTFIDLPYKSKTILSGQSTTLVLTAPPKGQYKFTCSVGNHQELGMTGVLQISNP